MSAAQLFLTSGVAAVLFMFIAVPPIMKIIHSRKAKKVSGVCV
jgi:hypothetical protein